MRLTSILMLSTCLQVSARVHSQTVSFSGKNVPLEKVFTSVEKQTGYVFFFDEAILKDAKPVTIRAENYPLQLFLSRVLDGQPLKFSFQNKTIVISRKELDPAPTPPAPDTTARPPVPPSLVGLVMDISGTPLQGASVTIKGSGKSALTNSQGAFRIPAPPAKSKVIVSFIGYTTKEVALSENQRDLYVQLAVAVNSLDEEVVQGYGKTSQRLAVANIIQVSGEEIQKQPVMNSLLALNGRVPGVVVSPVTGYVSAPVKVEIRGRNTLDPSLVSDPLYVIDGVPLTILDLSSTSFYKSSYANGSTGFIQSGLTTNTRGQSPLFSINPADIESISVLKDAAATAIYGSRGANGVILITTKRAQPGKTRLNIQVQQSVSSAPRHWDMLKTPQYVQMRREALKNDGLALTLANAPDLAGWDTTRYTDWQKKIWGVAKSTNASMSLSGGDRNTAFTLNADYTNSKDITTLNGTNQRISLSSGLTHHSPDQKMTVDLRATYSYTYVSAINMPNLTTLAPNAPPIFDAKGNLNYKEWNAVGIGGSFPFNVVLMPTIASSNFINGSLKVNYILAKGLTLGVLGGYSNAQTATSNFTPIAAQNPFSAFKPTGIAGFGGSTINNWNVEPQLNYTFYIGEGKLDCMAGGTYQSSRSTGTSIVAYGYTNDALIQSPGNAPYQSSSMDVAQKRYASVHGRINYNWQNKYIFELAGNRDGSSNFGPGRQFGNFWSVGGAWIASEEEWAKRILPSWWSFLKINASYGVTGLDAGGAYKYLSQWRTPNASSIPLYNGVAPLIPQQAVNQDYQWQENRKINTDLTLGFLKDRINLTLTWYRDRCNNQLANMPTPVFTGFSTVFANSPANVQNDGWEGLINAKLIASKNFSWSLGFNIGINRNKLVSYPDFERSPYYITQKIGRSLNTVYLYHYKGINPQTGQRSYVDYNHDGIIYSNSTVPPGTVNDDRYIALDITPRYSGGISSQFTYKRCMLNLFFNFKKQWGMDPFVTVPGGMGNIPTYVFNNHWQRPGDQTRYTRFTTVTLGGLNDANFAYSDGAYTDASYLRLNSLAFSYSLPENVCKKAHMQGLTLSINMSNVFTITSYKGIDPEINAFGNLPQARVIAGRISFNF
ncbi:MAG: SusC/RagA family TonB-linked outer membrane protein [Chitinophagaceae bacterium]|nr:SusC/RagA family TonB-linked outer membrane protein [Chitinophagaceae bacterium]